jgi:hypothetical protein
MHLRLVENKGPITQTKNQMPYGWEMDQFGPRPVAEEQWVLAYARKMKEFGFTYKEIASRLNHDTPSTNRDHERWRAGDMIELLDQHDDLLWLRWRKRKEKIKP